MHYKVVKKNRGNKCGMLGSGKGGGLIAMTTNVKAIESGGTALFKHTFENDIAQKQLYIFKYPHEHRHHHHKKALKPAWIATETGS